MNFNELNISNFNENLDTIPSYIDMQNFNYIIEIIRNAFKRLNINPEGKSIYYKRYTNGNSVLAIKVSQGDDNDISNYMFNGCDVFGGKCNVYMHSKPKSSQKSMNIANLISKEIVLFFEKIEHNLSKNNLSDIEFSIKIPLTKELDTKLISKKSKIKKLIKNMFSRESI